MHRLAACLTCLLVVKVTLVLAQGPAPLVLDAGEYWRFSSLVLAGDVLMASEPIAYRTPGYPWFLALVRGVSGGLALPAVVILQGILYVGTAIAAAALARQITGRMEAAVFTLAVLVLPTSAITYAATGLTESLFTATLMVHLWVVARYVARPCTRGALWSGATFAATLLVRPIVIWLWLADVVLLLLVTCTRQPQPANSQGSNASISVQRLLLQSLIAAVVVGVLIAPWLARNQRLFGRIFLTEFVGRNIWTATFQDGSGAELPLPDSAAGKELQNRVGALTAGPDWRATWNVSRTLTASGLDDAAADRLMKTVALDAIRAHPQRFAAKAFRRIVNFWRCAATDLPAQAATTRTVWGNDPLRTEAGDPYLGEQVWGARIAPMAWLIEHRWSQSVAGNTLLLLVIGLANLVIIACPATRWQGVWIALVLAYFTVVTGLIEIPAYRYRVVVEPLAAVTVGAAGAIVLQWALPRRQLESTEFAGSAKS